MKLAKLLLTEAVISPQEFLNGIFERYEKNVSSVRESLAGQIIYNKIKETGYLEEKNKKEKKKIQISIYKEISLSFKDPNNVPISISNFRTLHESILRYIDTFSETSLDDCLSAASLFYSNKNFENLPDLEKDALEKGNIDFNVVFDKTYFYKLKNIEEKNRDLFTILGNSDAKTSVLLYEDENASIYYPRSHSDFLSLIQENNNVRKSLNWCTQDISTWTKKNGDYHICILVSKNQEKLDNGRLSLLSLKLDLDACEILISETVDIDNIRIEKQDLISIFGSESEVEKVNNYLSSKKELLTRINIKNVISNMTNNIEEKILDILQTGNYKILSELVHAQFGFLSSFDDEEFDVLYDTFKNILKTLILNNNEKLNEIIFSGIASFESASYSFNNNFLLQNIYSIVSDAISESREIDDQININEKELIKLIFDNIRQHAVKRNSDIKYYNSFITLVCCYESFAYQKVYEDEILRVMQNVLAINNHNTFKKTINMLYELNDDGYIKISDEFIDKLLEVAFTSNGFKNLISNYAKSMLNPDVSDYCDLFVTKLIEKYANEFIEIYNDIHTEDQLSYEFEDKFKIKKQIIDIISCKEKSYVIDDDTKSKILDTEFLISLLNDNNFKNSAAKSFSIINCLDCLERSGLSDKQKFEFMTIISSFVEVSGSQASMEFMFNTNFFSLVSSLNDFREAVDAVDSLSKKARDYIAENLSKFKEEYSVLALFKDLTLDDAVAIFVEKTKIINHTIRPKDLLDTLKILMKSFSIDDIISRTKEKLDILLSSPMYIDTTFSKYVFVKNLILMKKSFSIETQHLIKEIFFFLLNDIKSGVTGIYEDYIRLLILCIENINIDEEFNYEINYYFSQEFINTLKSKHEFNIICAVLENLINNNKLRLDSNTILEVIKSKLLIKHIVNNESSSDRVVYYLMQSLFSQIKESVDMTLNVQLRNFLMNDVYKKRDNPLFEYRGFIIGMIKNILEEKQQRYFLPNNNINESMLYELIKMYLFN